VARKICYGPQIFFTLPWELRAPTSMGGEMFWQFYYSIKNLLVLHLNIEN
jgi:hypothetical protein